MTQKVLLNIVRPHWDRMGHKVFHKIVESSMLSLKQKEDKPIVRYYRSLHFSNIQLFTHIAELVLSFVMKDYYFNMCSTCYLGNHFALKPSTTVSSTDPYSFYVESSAVSCVSVLIN